MKKFRVVLFVCLAASPVGFAFTQQNNPDQSITAPASVQNEPVPVPPASDKALSYYHSGNILWFVEILWGMLIPALFFVHRFFPQRSATGLKKSEKNGFLSSEFILLSSRSFQLLSTCLSVITRNLSGSMRTIFSNQTFGKWAGDTLKSLMVGKRFRFLYRLDSVIGCLRKPRNAGGCMLDWELFLLCSSSCW